MECNPPPDSRSPADLVISEATAIRMLVRFYGWVVVEPGRLQRYRSAAVLPLIRLQGHESEQIPTAADDAAVNVAASRL